MSKDKQRLLEIMDSLDADYQSDKISEDKYRYFRSKYFDKLNKLEKSTGNSSQIPNSLKKQPLKPKSEEVKLIEKFILNPNNKKTVDSNKKVKKYFEPMDSGTFNLFLVLVLVIGFTVGIGVGVFVFDFGDFAILDVGAIVEDTVFPEVKEVAVSDVADYIYNNHTNRNTPQPQPQLEGELEPVNSTI